MPGAGRPNRGDEQDDADQYRNRQVFLLVAAQHRPVARVHAKVDRAQSETGEKSARMASKADEAAEADEQVEQQDPAQPRFLQADTPAAQSQNHQSQQAKDRTRRAHGRRPGTDQECAEGSADERDHVRKQEQFRAHSGFESAAQHPKAEHVDTEVDQPEMTEAAGDNSKELVVFGDRRAKGAEFAGEGSDLKKIGVKQWDRQNEPRDVEPNKDFGDHRVLARKVPSVEDLLLVGLRAIRAMHTNGGLVHALAAHQIPAPLARHARGAIGVAKTHLVYCRVLGVSRTHINV